MVGRVVAQYKFVEKLGAGGMGEIYKAQDTRLNRFVAIKVLPASKSGDPERRRRFLQEAQAASSLNHPSIITIHDVLSDGDTDFMVMEFVAGKTLNDLIPRGGLRVPQVLKYALQMSDALSVAHGAGIVHRDLKPANVMVTDSGLVKVLDFGLAKLTDPTPVGPIGQDAETVATSQPLTVEGSIMGTVSYMSPEQAQGKKIDPRSDIFSFGAVLYEMVTGRRAFDGESSLSTLSAILRDEVKPMSEVAPDVPQQLEVVILRCLRKSPDDRYQTMREVQNAMSLLKRESDSGSLYTTRSMSALATTVIMPPPPSQSGSAAQPSSPPPPSTQPGTASTPPTATIPPTAPAKSPNTVLVAAAGIVVVLAGIGGAYWWQQKQAAERAAAVLAREAEAAAQAAAQAQAQLEMQRQIDEAAKQAAEETLTNNNVLDLVTSKVPTQVILEHIRSAKETKFDLSTSELIRLSKAGVAPAVIEQMRNPKRTPPKLDVVATNTKQAAPATPAPAAAGVKPATPAPVPPPVPIATGDSHVLTPTPAPAPTPTPAAPAAAVETVSISIPEGVPFKMALVDDIPLDADIGFPLKFIATDDFRPQGSVVVRKGAFVYGEISETAKKKKIFGIGNGKLSFSLTKADGVGGQIIKVRAMAARRNDGPTQRPVDTGKSGTKTLAAAKGTEYLAYIDGPQTVNVPK